MSCWASHTQVIQGTQDPCYILFFLVKQRPALYLEACHRELCSRELVLFWLYGSSHVSLSKSATLILFSFGFMNLSMNMLSKGNNKLVPFLGGKRVRVFQIFMVPVRVLELLCEAALRLFLAKIIYVLSSKQAV